MQELFLHSVYSTKSGGGAKIEISNKQAIDAAVEPGAALRVEKSSWHVELTQLSPYLPLSSIHLIADQKGEIRDSGARLLNRF